MATSAREWKEANRKEITLPSGRTAVIRKLTSEFILVLSEFNDELTKPGAPKKVPGPDGKLVLKVPAAMQRRYLEQLVLEAVVEPKVVPAAKEAGEDAMHVGDFGADFDPLIVAIHEHNGDVLNLPFRAAPDGPAPAPAGEGVRGESEPVAEEAAGGPAV